MRMHPVKRIDEDAVANELQGRAIAAMRMIGSGSGAEPRRGRIEPWQRCSARKQREDILNWASRDTRGTVGAAQPVIARCGAGTQPALPPGLGNTSVGKPTSLLPFASRFGRPHTHTWLAHSLTRGAAIVVWPTDWGMTIRPRLTHSLTAGCGNDVWPTGCGMTLVGR